MSRKLKPLPKRLHNVLFHMHTVSGIVISFVLFIVFLCGAIAFFQDELYQWENPLARFEAPENVNFDKAIEKVAAQETCFIYEKNLSVAPPNNHNPFIKVYYGIENADGKIQRKNALVNPDTFEVINNKPGITSLGRTIYKLHYLRQLPVIGIYISGLAALFMLFAMGTGVLVHWKNIIAKFHAFSWKDNWKRIWTEGHISLGFLTLPLQLIYGVTGALLGLSILLLLPSTILFNGDRTKIFEIFRPEMGIKYDDNAADNSTQIPLATFYKKVKEEFHEHKVKIFITQHYGKEDGNVTLRIDDYKGLTGDGLITYSLKSGEILFENLPYQKTYSQSAYPLMIKLHYATFGGIFMKVIYFFLALVTCYVITSGTLLWQAARDNKKYTDKQRSFHFRITKVYLSLTLGLITAIGLFFWVNKLVPIDVAERITYTKGIFFTGWLLIFIAGLIPKSFRKITQFNLVLLAILALGIPILNGVITGDWIWNTLKTQQYYVAYVDLIWIIIAIISLAILFITRRNNTTKN